jgi:hypothetical protein
MSAEQIAALDEAAEREGIDRSEIVRRAVDEERYETYDPMRLTLRASHIDPWAFTFNGPGAVTVTFGGVSRVLQAGDSFHVAGFELVL